MENTKKTLRSFLKFSFLFSSLFKLLFYENIFNAFNFLQLLHIQTTIENFYKENVAQLSLETYFCLRFLLVSWYYQRQTWQIPFKLSEDIFTCNFTPSCLHFTKSFSFPSCLKIVSFRLYTRKKPSQPKRLPWNV